MNKDRIDSNVLADNIREHYPDLWVGMKTLGLGDKCKYVGYECDYAKLTLELSTKTMQYRGKVRKHLWGHIKNNEELHALWML